MAELLKHIYNTTFVNTYSDALSEVVSTYDKDSFMAAFTTAHWASLELKQRMAYLAHITNKMLPSQYADKVATILKLIDALRSRGVKDQNLEYIFLADIIADQGMADLTTSIYAIEKITQFVSFEFAGRAFIVQYPSEMMAQMNKWAHHKNPNVRRYASEGCRPRLPWGLQLRQFVLDPSPIISILEQLKDDDSEYVRKSVANNLNDISKDHPDLLVSVLQQWKGTSPNTDWIIKHGARTLLKQGHKEALSIFGTHQDATFTIDSFRLEETDIQHGNNINFSFTLTNDGEQSAAFRIEYFVWYVKANGLHTKKIFKISERPINAKSSLQFTKYHQFRDLTTRKHYAGTHKISIVVNGNEGQAIDFLLKT